MRQEGEGSQWNSVRRDGTAAKAFTAKDAKGAKFAKNRYLKLRFR